MILLFVPLTLLLAPSARTFVVSSAESEVRVHVGKAGLFRFAGHEHEVASVSLSGSVVADPGDLKASSVSLAFEAKDLKVLSEGEPPDDVPKIQERMLQLLEVQRFPKIVFESSAVEGSPSKEGFDLTVTGTLSLHGMSRTLHLPIRASLAGDTLTASGQATLKHGDYALVPVSVAGVVKVKEEIAIRFKIVAHSAP